jgi:hypothetical protein
MRPSGCMISQHISFDATRDRSVANMLRTTLVSGESQLLKMCRATWSDRVAKSSSHQKSRMGRGRQSPGKPRHETFALGPILVIRLGRDSGVLRSTNRRRRYDDLNQSSRHVVHEA